MHIFSVPRTHKEDVQMLSSILPMGYLYLLPVGKILESTCFGDAVAAPTYCAQDNSTVYSTTVLFTALLRLSSDLQRLLLELRGLRAHCRALAAVADHTTVLCTGQQHYAHGTRKRGLYTGQHCAQRCLDYPLICSGSCWNSAVSVHTVVTFNNLRSDHVPCTGQQYRSQRCLDYPLTCSGSCWNSAVSVHTVVTLQRSQGFTPRNSLPGSSPILNTRHRSSSNSPQPSTRRLRCAAGQPPASRKVKALREWFTFHSGKQENCVCQNK